MTSEKAKKSNPLKIILRTLAILFAMAALTIAGVAFFMSRGLEEGATLMIEARDGSGLPDGRYEGHYQGGRWRNTVAVEIRSGRIEAVEVLDPVQFERPEMTEELIGRVIEQQTTAVDVISGATVTSKAYLKAVADALAPQS